MSSFSLKPLVVFFLPDFRGPNSRRPGISKYYEHGKALELLDTCIAPRNPNLVFLFFFCGNVAHSSEEFNSIILELIKIFMKKKEDDAVEKI